MRCVYDLQYNWILHIYCMYVLEIENTTVTSEHDLRSYEATI